MRLAQGHPERRIRIACACAFAKQLSIHGFGITPTALYRELEPFRFGRQMQPDVALDLGKAACVPGVVANKPRDVPGLEFSGVTQKIVAAGSTTWSDVDDDELRRSLATWYGRFVAIFPEESGQGPRPFQDSLWERARLAKGDCLPRSGPNWSFLKESDDIASWRRLLRADTSLPDGRDRREVVRRVLSELRVEDPEASLRAIVERGVQGLDHAAPGLRDVLVRHAR